MRALLALALALASAAPATAASVNVDDGRLIVFDADGVANAIHVSIAADGRHQVVDAAGVIAYTGCEQVDAITARCEPTARVLAHLQDGADLFAADAALTVPLEVLAGRGDDRIQGGGGPDQVDGNDGHDQIDGGPGDDLLSGWEGDDLLSGGDGADRLQGYSGYDELDGGLGRDHIDGGWHQDRLHYDGRDAGVRVTLPGPRDLPEGEDEIRNVEIVVGTPHADVIQGGGDNEQLDGGDGDDRISGGGADDVVIGGPGADVLFGDTENLEAPSELPGTWGGRDDLRGGPGDDRLRGDSGRDRLAGDEGDDVVDAREGVSTQEVLDEEPVCGAGADRAVLDWNDEPFDCEQLEVRPRPGFPRPPRPLFVPGGTGPGPQPVLGRPAVRAGVVRVPVFCATACVARVTVRTVRVGERRRSRAGRGLVTRRAQVATGTVAEVALRLPARARRGRVVVELRIGRRRWQRPLTLGS